jgi:hypothetical protein
MQKEMKVNFLDYHICRKFRCDEVALVLLLFRILSIWFWHRVIVVGLTSVWLKVSICIVQNIGRLKLWPRISLKKKFVNSKFEAHVF